MSDHSPDDERSDTAAPVERSPATPSAAPRRGRVGHARGWPRAAPAASRAAAVGHRSRPAGRPGRPGRPCRPGGRGLRHRLRRRSRPCPARPGAAPPTPPAPAHRPPRRRPRRPPPAPPTDDRCLPRPAGSTVRRRSGQVARRPAPAGGPTRGPHPPRHDRADRLSRSSVEPGPWPSARTRRAGAGRARPASEPGRLRARSRLSPARVRARAGVRARRRVEPGRRRRRGRRRAGVWPQPGAPGGVLGGAWPDPARGRSRAGL